MSEVHVFFEKIFSVISTYSWISDTLDLLLITFIIYSALKMIRDSRALTFAKGIVIFILVYMVVTLLDMQASSYLFRTIFDNFLLILIVIFAPEIRKILENIGTSNTILFFNKANLKSLFSGTGANQKAIQYNEDVAAAVNEICRAASDMSDKKIGALMIFEKNTPLGEIINTGTVLDATISSELVGNVFYPKSPLHDGAAVIRDLKLYAAGCILPLTSKNDISSDLGTRHRAAIGMSEQSDAMVLVISEETGSISIAKNGTLHRNISDGEAREMLLDFLRLPVDTKKESKAEGRDK